MTKLKKWIITVYFECGEKQKDSVIFLTFDKEKIQNIFDLKCLHLEEGEEVEYSKEDEKEFSPRMLVVTKKNGKLVKEVVKGNKVYYKSYIPALNL